MKHKVKMQVKVRKKGFFGERIVTERRTVYMDDKQYRQYRKEEKRRKRELENGPDSFGELLFYDYMFDDD